MEQALPSAYADLVRVRETLERHYLDMQDIEFTVQQNKLYMLQTRSGKRTAAASLRIAVEMAEAGLIDRNEAVRRVNPASLDQLLHPTLDPKAVEDVVVGCAMPEGAQGLNVARIATLLAGLPNTVGGITVNRFCSSGLNAVAIAADRIRVGEADVMIAAGTESITEQNRQRSSVPSVDSARSTMARAVDGFGAARIIVP